MPGFEDRGHGDDDDDDNNDANDNDNDDNDDDGDDDDDNDDTHDNGGNISQTSVARWSSLASCSMSLCGVGY